MAWPRKTLIGYTMSALMARDVSPTYRAMVLAHVKSFVRWKGKSLHIGELNCDDVNDWLNHLRTLNLSPYTIDTYRRNLLSIWRQAYEDRLNDNPPLRVRKIKRPRQLIEAYTLFELKQLLHAASKLRGRHKNGNRRCDFWQAFIHAAYSTGLRRGDLLLVFRKDIEQDGSYSLVQSKTGIPHRVKFSNEALAYIARLKDPNGLALPWPYRKDAMAPRFQSLKRLAGVTRGSIKWIRRSAGSHAERINPGDGPRLLGHSPHVFKSHYQDHAITQRKPPEPPPLR